ncbi:hypothetical protein [Edaphovirga cremea]|uniref:hypothetical protein n=1 Tax=Edaphovirga cremea TaxID=2267246 RepID=UPI003988C193
MKPVINLRLDTEVVAVADMHLMLELSACGRGFITALTDTDYTKKLVRLDLGYNEVVYRYFTGFVERSQPAENGAQRLFVRELIGGFERQWPLSIQHPTLRDVTDTVTKNTGMVFALPDNASYTDTPIPHVTHHGTGYQLLANLGRAFSIDDYVWFQLPDGVIYVGSYADSRFANAPIDIPPDFVQTATAGNTWTLAVIPAIRPGVIVNGRRITQVRVENDQMSLSWTPADSSGRLLQKPPEQRQIDKFYPELAAGLHLPRQARVMGPTDTATLGDQADAFRPRYAVDLQLLDETGAPAANTPVYRAVPLPVPMATAEGGMYQYPPEGAIVEIGFAEGRPDKPLIRQTLQNDLALPDIKPGEQLQQQRAAVSQRVTTDGSWRRETDQAIEEASASRTVSSDSETRTTTTRSVTVKANDTTTVLGTSALMAGSIKQLAEGDITSGTRANMLEKIGGIRKSVTDIKQQFMAPKSWVGSNEINVLQCLLDTLDVIQQLANQTAEHAHPGDWQPPVTAAEIAATGAQAGTVKDKYAPSIE